MASAIASELRFLAKRLEWSDPAPWTAEETTRYAASLMRMSADQLEKHLKTLKKYRAERRMKT